jgi:hypothetical protein
MNVFFSVGGLPEINLANVGFPPLSDLLESNQATDLQCR